MAGKRNNRISTALQKVRNELLSQSKLINSNEL